MATVVLVHGTTSGGWNWRHIAPRLRAEGHTVYTPTLTGLGERAHLAHPGVDLDTHVTDIVNVMLCEELTDVVLVGHSYGGMVITGVADRVPERVSLLVYLDALVPRDGESTWDLQPPEVRAHIGGLVQSEGQGWLIPIMRGENDIPVHNTPHPFRSWTQPLRLSNPAATAAIPKVYMRFTADKKPGQFFQLALAESWRRVQEAGWPVYEVDTMHQITP
ncbi:MAG: alpha/beta fold hydrolase, partial [Chloroflexota bacterium]